MGFLLFCNNDATKEKSIEKNLDWILYKNGRVTSSIDIVEQQINDVDFQTYNDGDVLELSENSGIQKILSADEEETFLYITNKCNSNCIMCPSPDIERKSGIEPEEKELFELIRYYPQSINYFTLTGGEPLLRYKFLFKVIDVLKERFANAGYLLLTNARGFAIKELVREFNDVIPENILVGIPFHSYDPKIFNMITRSNGSYEQTLSGINNLLAEGINIEIRVVISRMNYKQIPKICSFIANVIPSITIVTFMCMEMTGNAAINRKELWVPIKETIPYLNEGISELIVNSIDFRFYNYPLCLLPKAYWSIAKKSISKEKIRYLDGCSSCENKQYCGGFFASSRLFMEKEICANV